MMRLKKYLAGDHNMAILDGRRTADLDRDEVKKNIFGILSMFIFLATTIIWLVIGTVILTIRPGSLFVYYAAVCGYILAICSEIISIIINSKNKNIDPERSGSYHGFTSLFLSIFMVLYIVAYKL